MHGLRLEWHAAKNAENRRKHGVGFEEARTAFLDEQVIRLISARRASPTERRQYARLLR